MLDKNFLQSFLHVNNASESMSDVEVRAVLQKAGWSESEVLTALALLRSKTNPSTESAGTHMPFHQGMEFSSSQLSHLLGVDVEIDPGRLQTYQGAVSGSTFSLQQLISGVGIVLLATGLAVGAGLFLAYVSETGPFHA